MKENQGALDIMQGKAPRVQESSSDEEKYMEKEQREKWEVLKKYWDDDAPNVAEED
jgi:hypothetical protein